MSLYYFDFIGLEVVRDEEGTEMRDLDQVRRQAVSLAGAHLRDHPEIVSEGQAFGLRVRDERDSQVCGITVTCGDRPAAA